MEEYEYYRKFNGSIITEYTNDFVKAHNYTFYSGANEFTNQKTGDKIPIKHKLITSEEDYNKK